MGNTDRAVGFIDVLSSGAVRSIGINAQVLFLDLDFDIILDIRQHVAGGKARMPPLVGIKRRDREPGDERPLPLSEAHKHRARRRKT